MPPPPPEPVKIGSHPRDLPRSALEGSTGTAEVLGPVGSRVSVALGDMEVHALGWPVDSEFTIHATATHDGQTYDGTWRFRTTGDDADVGHHTVGPGLTVERGRWGRRTYSGFEFGVLVMGAVRTD